MDVFVLKGEKIEISLIQKGPNSTLSQKVRTTRDNIDRGNSLQNFLHENSCIEMWWNTFPQAFKKF